VVKDKDPSDIMNDVNGFDIITCKGLQEVQVVVVIPNLGYGFLSTMCARMTKGKGVSTPGSSMSYKITSGTEAVQSTESTKVVGSGKELFVPSSGMDARMFTTRCNMNDVCSTGGALSNDIILPIPLKISLEDPNDFTTTLETKSYMTNPQEALFRALLDICNSMSISGPFEDTVQSSAAAQIVRAFSTTLNSESNSQWTGDVAAETERVEYMHLGSAEPGNLGAIGTWVARTMESWDRKIQKTNVPPESTDLFIRPFAAILAPSPDGKKRLYYSPELTEKLFQMEIRGVQTSPKVICESTLYLLNPEDNSVTSPSWGTVVGSASIESALGINHEDYWIVSSEVGRINYVFSKDQIYGITSLKAWDPAAGQEESKTARLYTFRPPVFTSGGIIADNTDSSDIYRLLFSSAYYYPTATAEISDSVYGTCTRCAGTGIVGSVTCLNCKGAGNVPCFNCAGKNIPHNVLTGTTDESTGYITDTDALIQRHCKYCNPASGEDPEDSDLYISVEGRLKDLYCEGTGAWDQVTCPACAGTKVSYQSKESTIGDSDMIIVYDGAGTLVKDTVLESYDSRGQIVKTNDPGTYHIEIPVDIPMIDGANVDWIPESYTVEITDRSTEETAVLSPAQESPVKPGTDLDLFTYTKNAQLQISIPLESMMNTPGPFDIKIYAVKDSPTDFGYFWTTNELEIPTRTIGPNIIRSMEDLYKLMFKDPREIDDIPWDSGVDYEIGDIVVYSSKLYECTTGHTSSSFAADLGNWSMIGYSPDPDEVPRREGFGHLACAIDHFIDIVGTPTTLSSTACYRKYDTKSINEGLEGLDLYPSKISDGQPLKLYTGTIADNLSTFISDRADGDEDELFLTSKLPGANVLKADEHRKVWQNKIPSDMTDLEVWEITLNELADVNPATADVYEERIYPYGMRKTAKYIIGPKTPSAKASVDKSKEIPVGSYGSSTDAEVSPIDVPANAQVSDSGIVDIVGLLSSSSSMAGSTEGVSSIKSIIESIPPVIDKIVSMSEEVLAEVDLSSEELIVSPEPLFAYDYVTSGEVPTDKIYISQDGADNAKFTENLGIVRDVLSSSSGSSLPPLIQEFNVKFKQGMSGIDKVIASPSEGSGTAQSSASLLCEALGYCYSIIDSLESKTIVDVEYGADCTVFMVLDNNGENTVMAVPREYANKGLWYYNLRKTYYMLKSSLNLCKALMEKSYSMLAAIKVGYSQAPFPQTGIVSEDTQYSNISYHDMDLSIFKGEDGSSIYPAIMGEDSWPEYTTNDDWDEEYGVIDLSGISSQIELNTIGQYFAPGSIGYSLSIDFSGHNEISQENDPIFLMGMGLGSSDSTLGTSEQIPYVSRTAIQAVDSEGVGWHTLSELTESDIYSKVESVQSMTGAKDHLKREGSGVVGYLTASGTKGTTSYSSLADMRSKIINGNLSDIVPFMGKPPLKGLIDMSYVFPYLSNYSESFVFNLPLYIDFKPSQPKYIQELLDSPDLDSISDLSDLFKCTSTKSSSSYLGTSSIFTDWDKDKADLDNVAKVLAEKLSQGSWIYELVKDTSVPYQVSFAGFTDPATRQIGSDRSLGTCLLVRYLIEYGISETLYDADALLALMAQDEWNYQADSDLHSNYNYNLFLSKRRAFIVAKYIVGSLLSRSKPGFGNGGISEVTTRDRSRYRSIIFETPVSHTDMATAVSSLPSTYDDYKTGWTGIYLQRLFKPYGFGDLASNATTVKGSDDMRPQRTVMVSAPHPGETPSTVSLRSGDHMSCTLPLGRENISSTTKPRVELSRKSIYYPTTEKIIQGEDSSTMTVNWKTNPTYTVEETTDVFDKSSYTYTRNGSQVSTVSTVFKELGKYMGGDVDSGYIDGMIAMIAKDDSVKEKVVRYIEGLVSSCFVKSTAGAPDPGETTSTYTNYGKAFYAHGTCLDNIWLLVVKKD
jgi:hypothetical protein